jgi:hypothetical protein
MIRTGSDEVCRISTKSAVPHPTLVASQRALKLKWLRFRRFIVRTWDHLLKVLDFPYLRSVVGTACSEMLDVRGKENASNVLPVGFEVGNWY